MTLQKAVESLLDVVRLQSQSIDRLGEKIEQSSDRTEASIDRLSGEITKLTVQVGSFASSVSEMKATMRQLVTETQQQNETAKLQAQNVAALIELVR